MPYKDPKDPRVLAYRKEYLQRPEVKKRIRKQMKLIKAKYREKNKEKIAQYRSEYYQKNKESSALYSKKNVNVKKRKKRVKKDIVNLSDTYMKRLLYRAGFLKKDLLKNPNLIEQYRVYVKGIRLRKELNNPNLPIPPKPVKPFREKDSLTVVKSIKPVYEGEFIVEKHITGKYGSQFI